MNNTYASFWLRAIAITIDVSLIILLLYILKSFLPQYINLFWIDLLFPWLYFSLSHSSSKKATIGKKLVGIEVVGYEGKRINFKQASIRFFASLISSTLLLPYLIMFFTNKKQTIHDMLAKTVVIDISRSTKKALYNQEKIDEDKLFKKVKTPIGRKLSYVYVVLLIGAMLYQLYPAIALVAVYSYMYSSNKKAYDKSFHTVYSAKDYNDPRIDFYIEELEKSSKDLVSAQGIVDIFEHDTKVDLTLDCIRYYLKENNETDWIEEGSKIRKNARNKFAINDDLIKNTKSNEDNMGQNFYLYDLNLVNDTINDITNLWHDKSKQSLCDQNLSAEQLYDIFLTKYLAKYIDEHVSSKQRKLSPTDDHKFFKNKHEQEAKWLAKITKKSSQDLYQQFSQGKITLEDVSKYNHFQASLSTRDIAFGDNELIVADGKRGIELWSINSDNRATFKKTLSDKYKAARIKKVGSFIFVIATDQKSNCFFLAFSYDKKTKSINELYKTKISLDLDLKEWVLFDDNKIAIAPGGRSPLLTLNVSNPENIKIIRKESEILRGYSRDLAINEKTKKIYELSSRGLNIYSTEGDSISIETLYTTFKNHLSLVVNQKDNILYTLEIVNIDNYFLYKYSLDDPNKPKLISSKAIDIDLYGWNHLHSVFPKNMKLYQDKLYIANKNSIYIFDKELKKVGNLETSNIYQFYFLEDKIIYSSGKGGVSFVDLKKDPYM